MKKVTLFLAFCVLLFGSQVVLSASNKGPKKEVVGVTYFQHIFGQVHKNPSRYSTSLTTVACGQPVKVYRVAEKDMPAQTVFNGIWNFVKVGPYEGYMMADHLVKKRPVCFQDKYPKFFEQFDVDLSELYYWGRLYDLYITGKSKVK